MFYISVDTKSSIIRNRKKAYTTITKSMLGSDTFFIEIPDDKVEVKDGIFLLDKEIVPYCNSDEVKFNLKTALANSEKEAKGVIKKLADGTLEHSVSEEDGSINVKNNKINNIDIGTFNLIKDWCRTQAEGCEEAFINLGIEDKTNAKYLAYLAERQKIIDDQHQVKIDEGLI